MRCGQALDAMDDGLTKRQQDVLYFYYQLGWSFRLIAHACRLDQRTVRREHDAALLWLRTEVEECRTPPSIEGLFSSSGSTPTRDAGTALRRQEQLTDALESWLDARAERLCEIEQCMDGNCPTPTHHKRNNLDQWEMAYLLKHGRRSMGTSDYDAKRLDEFCAQCATHWTWDGGCERRTC